MFGKRTYRLGNRLEQRLTETCPSKLSSKTAAHYVWGCGCDGWHLVNQPGLSVIQERMPPGTTEVRHFHRLARQFFFVLQGSASLESAGVEHLLGPHEGLEVPPGTPHQISNSGSTHLVFLVISSPHSHGDRKLIAQGSAELMTHTATTAAEATGRDNSQAAAEQGIAPADASRRR